MEVISDDELVLRHVPAGEQWQAPGPRITSANFQLRADRNETGVSVSRASITSVDALLDSLATTSGSRVASARVADIRALGLQVVSAPLPHDSGHAEIRDGHASLSKRGTRKRLAECFHLLGGAE